MYSKSFCILLLILISLFAGSSTLGQRPSRSRTARGISTENPALAVITTRDVPEKRAFNHREKIEWRYDNIKDITVVNLDKMWIGPHYRLSAYFGCYGQGCDASTPSFVRIYVTTASSSRWRFGKAPTLRIFSGEHVKGIRPEYEREVQPSKTVGGSSYGPYYTEYLKFDLSTREFLNMVNAERVDIRIGAESVKFTEDNLEALRDLASRLPIKR